MTDKLKKSKYKLYNEEVGNSFYTVGLTTSFCDKTVKCSKMHIRPRLVLHRKDLRTMQQKYVGIGLSQSQIIVNIILICRQTSQALEFDVGL